MWRDDAYLGDIVRAIRKIESYVGDRTCDELASNGMALDAVLYQIAIIGEAARSISQ